MNPSENYAAIVWTHFSHLRNEEHFTAHSEISALLGGANAETLHAAANGTAHIAVKGARAAIDKIYARIRNRVNSYVDEDTPNQAVDAFVAQLNVITKRFNTLAARHHHKKGGKGGDETGV